MIAFTICSNNYLDKALILKDSLKEFDDLPVYLILADSKSDIIDYDNLGFDKIITPDELGIKNLAWQMENYEIVEFNTALKSSAFEYIFQYTKTDLIYYFDPDIKLYQSLTEFEVHWKGASILLTPHILSPIPLDNNAPDENLFLNHGIYNLGFLGLKRSNTTFSFLNWWSSRLAEKCLIDLKEGYFTDQIWINLVPLLFKDVSVIEHPGFNAAYWNLHERKIELVGGTFLVNNNLKLCFYHFSSFDFSLNRLSSFKNARFNFENRPEILDLYLDYKKSVQKYTSLNYRTILYFNGKYPKNKPQKKIITRVKMKLISILNGSN